MINEYLFDDVGLKSIMMTKEHRYHIISSLSIFLFGGILGVAVFCTGCLDEPYLFSRKFWINFSYNGVSWMSYWKGSELLVALLDRLIPWVKAPLLRLFTSLVSIVVFVFVVVWGLDLFFDLVFLNKTLESALQASGAPFVNVLIVTLGMNVIMHGRGFLFSWRQASIDNERLKTEQVFTQFQSLKNQVNPHFLFNSLNALSSLVYEDQGKAVEFIRKLSQVYRYVLERKDEEIIPIKDELAFLNNFVFLQKIRFGENLKFTISGNSEEGHLPPLALQLLVENAIKHNVISEQHHLNINVIINSEYCEVTNNVREKLSKDSTGIGLNNLRDRYKYLTDREVTIKKNGEIFSVKIPILNVKK